MVFYFFKFFFTFPITKTKKAIIPAKINPVMKEKFLPVSEITLLIAFFCSIVISSPLKNPSLFKSNFINSYLEEISV